LKDDIFYGVIEITQKGKKILLDTRPSDALALAVRTHVPIFISEQIMESASIVPVEEEYFSSLTENKEIPFVESPSSPEQDKENIDRLSVFEEYLQNLETDHEKDEENDENDDEEDDEYPDGNISAI